MAEIFDVETSYDDVEFLGGSRTQDVLVTGIRTKPHGIYIEVRVGKALFEQEGAQIVNAAALGWATIFETLAVQPHVAGVAWGQESAGGQLQDVAVITVSSSTGASSAALTIPVTSLGPKLGAAAIGKLSKQLDAVEAL
jgi:hypothetical protein